MSTANLQLFLEYLIDDIEGSSDAYREKVANIKEHVFVFSGVRLHSQTLSELVRRGIIPTNKQDDAIKRAALDTYVPVKEAVKNSLTRHETTYKQTRHPETKFGPTSLTAVYQIATTEKGNRVKVFPKIKNAYGKAINAYYAKVRGIMAGHELPEEQERGKVLQAGHAQDKGVLETRVSEAVEAAVLDISDYNLKQFVTKSRTKLALRLRAIMSSKTDSLEIIVESAKENRADATHVRKMKEDFLKSAHAAVERITKGKGFPYFEGSDSPIKATRKKAIKEVTDPLRKIKGIKVVTEDTKPNPSKRKAKKDVTKKITREGVRTPPLRDPRTGRFISKKQAQSSINLLAILNAKLPEKLAENMQWPALVWRTGVFARSVRALNVSKTAQGHTLVGYTYLKEPYGVFEPGRSMGTMERDPRRLIDKSIREIAVGLVTHRLETRREF